MGSTALELYMILKYKWNLYQKNLYTSVVIDVCPLCSVLHVACLSFEVYHLFNGQSVLWDQRAIACPGSQSENSCHALVKT